MSSVQHNSSLFDLRFSSVELQQAWTDWGCNCGPSALAAALKIGLDDAHDLIVDFAKKKYTSPTMMFDALSRSGVGYYELGKNRKVPAAKCPGCFPSRGLVRVQWTGPWTAPGMNAKWAYGHTHWFATLRVTLDRVLVFDVNSGPVAWLAWLNSVPLKITDSIPRADGGWFVTHLIQVDVKS